MKLRYVVLFTLPLMISIAANASEIIYRGINPDITPTANPLNGSNIQFEAGLSKPSAPSTDNTLSESELLKQSVISGLSSTYQTLLTGSSPGNGTVNFGDGSYATYTTSGGTRYITFYDTNGTSTQISFPIQ